MVAFSTKGLSDNKSPVDCESEMSNYENNANYRSVPACVDENIIVNMVIMVNRRGHDL